MELKNPEEAWDEMIAKIGQSDRLVILKKPFDNIEVLQLANSMTAKWHLLQQARSQMDHLETIVRQRTEELRGSEERFRRGLGAAVRDDLWNRQACISLVLPAAL